MKTDMRLSRAYESAKIIEFDDSSKFIFFSDVHRGDNSISDDFAHNQTIYYHALNHYYNNGYSYIEVGDGDELWEHSRFKHVRSAHSDVFMLLKKFHLDNRFHMIYGNHNMEFKNHHNVKKQLYTFDDEYLDIQDDLFENIEVVEAILLKHKTTNQKIFVVHGHQGDLMNDHLWHLSKFWMRYFWRFMHIIGFRNPSSPAKNRIKRHKIEKNYVKWIEKHKVMLICGHTHRPKYPSEGEMPYFNDGCCVHPRGINGIEIENGQISLIYWKVVPDEKGQLFIEKNNIKGPDPLVKFRLD